MSGKIKSLVMLCIVLFCGILPGILLSGCNVVKTGREKVKDIDFVMVEDQELPKELKKLIEERKDSTIRMTYTTGDATYLVAGYGTQPTNGFSICVNEVYLGKNAIYADFNLIGPAAGQPITELPTTPYVVIRIDKTNTQVIFDL